MDKYLAGQTQCLRFSDYTVGWISALPLEQAAARKMLDNEHYPLAQDANDPVVYTYGSIGNHNVVLACLQAGQIGNNSAATVAAGMRLKFPYLRFGLLVGIAGGVPSVRDVRLGDIVVCQPNAGHGGVIQHDFGKNTVSGFERTSFVNGPPDILLSALSAYQASNLDSEGGSNSHYFKPKTASSMPSRFPAPDMLFQADYEHINKGDDCTGCDPHKLCKPIDRNQRGIMVHYGTIASGNQVIKNGMIRDQISKELGGVLCYEMEAAGVMNTLRCLVIRGICDYSDSHKNKEWQSYAALVAATYTKELLSFVPPVRTYEVPRKGESMMNLKLGQSFKASKMHSMVTKWQSSRGELSEYGFKTQNISNYDALRVHSALVRLRCPETTQWVLDHEIYQTWNEQDGATLWLTGKIGSGKTIITSTIIEHLLDTAKDKELVLHFFYRHWQKTELTAFSLVNSCIKQTLDYLESAGYHPPSNIWTRLKVHYNENQLSYDFLEVIHEILEPLLSLVDKTILVIDGLDECENSEIPKILKFARIFTRKPGRNVLVSGRESLDIVHSIRGAFKIQISKYLTDDISIFIRWKIEEKMLDRRIIEDPAVRAEIETTLSNGAEQMILWVSLQIENIWADCANDSDIREALKNLPKDLTETYDRCLHRIFRKEGVFAAEYAFKALLWILEAVHPLSVMQLRQALAIESTSGILDYDRIPSIQDTMRSCANLVVENIEGHVLLAHHSVYQYLYSHIEAGQLQETSSSLPKHSRPLLSSLAMLCVSHLMSAHYSLALQPTAKSSVLRLEKPVVSRLTESIPRYMKSFLPQPKAIQIRLPPKKPKRVANAAELLEFFHFAREQWPELTRVFLTVSKHWIISGFELEDFASLILQPNITWRLHPWEPLGQSLDSHYAGLLAWAIVNRHEPMLQALFSFQQTKFRIDLYITPFQQYEDRNAISLAARSNEVWIFETIRQRLTNNNCNGLLWSRDSQKWNVLEHAVDSRSVRLVPILASHFSIADIKMSLKLAAIKGYDDIVKLLLEFPDVNNLDSRLLITEAAIRNGHRTLLAAYPDVLQMFTTGVLVDWLIEAARSGHASVINYISQANLPQYSDLWYRSMLLAAIEANQGSVVACMIVDSKNLYGVRDMFYDACMLAGSLEDLRILDQLIDEFSLQFHPRDISGINRLTYKHEVYAGVLHGAIKQGSLRFVRALLARGFDVNLGKDGIVPLYLAISCQEEAIASLLIEYEACLFPDFLFLAIGKDSLTITKLLLDNGLSPTAKSKEGASALGYAVLFGSLAIVKLLSSYFSDMNISDDSQTTLLMYAAKAGHVDKVEWLCKKLSSSELKVTNGINSEDREGHTALFYSSIDCHLDCIKILLDHGADPKVCNHKGQTVLHTVTQAKVKHPSLKIKTMKEFIDTGCIDIDAQDYLGRTALHLAAMNHDGATAILLQNGADITIKEKKKGYTALHIAAAMTDSDQRNSSLDLILREASPADLDEQDYEGNTALHLAVKWEVSDAVKYLTTSGADRYIKNHAGESPISLVQAGHMREIRKILL